MFTMLSSGWIIKAARDDQRHDVIKMMPAEYYAECWARITGNHKPQPSASVGCGLCWGLTLIAFFAFRPGKDSQGISDVSSWYSILLGS
jgi:hypothetical protein